MKSGDAPTYPEPGRASGLSKREYFAAMAMQGLLAGDPDIPFAFCAEIAESYANALLARLEEDRT